MELKIEKGVPLPGGDGRGKSTAFTDLVRDMDVGDMIKLPFRNTSAQSNYMYQARRATAGSGKKFTTRKIDADTLGLWRTE